MSPSDDVVSDGKVVWIRYRLRAGAEASPTKGELAYVHGSGNLITGLEQALRGRSVGERVVVDVPPEQAYGAREGNGVHTLPRHLFPDEAELQPGMQLLGQDPVGNTAPVWVLEVGDDEVVLDFEHPLAGQTLTFDVTIRELRDATAQELGTGRPRSFSEDEE